MSASEKSSKNSKLDPLANGVNLGPGKIFLNYSILSSVIYPFLGNMTSNLTYKFPCPKLSL